jgi:hypothetical protein
MEPLGVMVCRCMATISKANDKEWTLFESSEPSLCSLASQFGLYVWRHTSTRQNGEGFARFFVISKDKPQFHHLWASNIFDVSLGVENENDADDFARRVKLFLNALITTPGFEMFGERGWRVPATLVFTQDYWQYSPPLTRQNQNNQEQFA